MALEVRKMKNNYFGHNLKYLRKCYRLSQQQAGEIVGKTYSAVSLWERELREPSNDDVQGYCAYFGLEPADLVYRKLDEQTPSVLSSDERELLALSRMMSSEQVKALISVARTMVK